MTLHNVVVLGCMLCVVPIAFTAECSGEVMDDDAASFIQVGKVAQKQEVARHDSPPALGEATKEIDGSRQSCRDHQCEYGTLLCNALLDYAQQEKPDRGVIVALYNAGGIRGSIQQGEVTAKDIDKVHPFGNDILVANVSAESILKMVKNALKEHGPPGTGDAGNWPQVAGMSFKASWCNQTESWTLCSIDVGGRILGTEGAPTHLQIVTNKYIMDGNGGRHTISGAASHQETLAKKVPELMKDYFKENSPISPPTENFNFEKAGECSSE